MGSIYSVDLHYTSPLSMPDTPVMIMNCNEDCTGPTPEDMDSSGAAEPVTVIPACA